MSSSTFCKLEPMDLVNAKGEGEAELQVSEQQREILRCYTCGSTIPCVPGESYAKSSKLIEAESFPTFRSLVRHGKTSTPSKAWGVLLGDELGSVIPRDAEVSRLFPSYLCDL